MRNGKSLQSGGTAGRTNPAPEQGARALGIAITLKVRVRPHPCQVLNHPINDGIFTTEDIISMPFPCLAVFQRYCQARVLTWAPWSMSTVLSPWVGQQGRAGQCSAVSRRHQWHLKHVTTSCLASGCRYKRLQGLWEICHTHPALERCPGHHKSLWKPEGPERGKRYWLTATDPYYQWNPPPKTSLRTFCCV